MARITKNAKSESTAAPAKVGKVNKSAAKPAKAESAEAKEPKAPRRSQWAGQKIKLTEAGKAETPARNGALIRFQAITKHKTTDEAIGSTYTDSDGSERKVTGADVAYLVKRGLIELS